MALNIKHLLGLKDVSKNDIQLILDTATTFREVLDRPIKKVPTLKGTTIVNLFYENSTRTRLSFELAEKRLSADTLNFTTSSSSTKKGETFKDTVRNIEAMKIDMIVVRHQSAGVPLYLTKISNASIINAGDGRHEHPTQALLDMYSIREKLGKLAGLRVCLVGDIAHSRVALSNIYGLITMGAKVSVCAPPTMLPRNIEKFGVKIYHDINKAVAQNDVINVLRIQLERDAGNTIPSLREYRTYFGVNSDVIENNNKDILILHPGPINRGVELTSDVADGPYQIILNQVTNGVAIRMAVLYLLGTKN